MSPRVLVVIADGIEELEAVTVIDVLRRAQADVTVAGVSGKQITAGRGLKIVADVLISKCIDKTYDMIVLPGGLPGAENLRDSVELTDMLKKQADSDRFYAAICASPAYILQRHGLLKGRCATCYPSCVDMLEKKTSADQRVVIDGNCITSQGPATAIEFALTLVEVLFDRRKRDNIAAAMLVI